MTQKYLYWLFILLILQMPFVYAEQDELSSEDREFVEVAAKGNLLEIELGHLATQRTARPDVQHFAERMVQDHSQSNEKLREIAEDKGLELPEAFNEEQRSTIQELAQLTGDEFDRRYLETMVEEHQETIDKFNEQATSGDDPKLRKFAENSLPILEQHYQQAQLLEMKFGNEGKPSPP